MKKIIILFFAVIICESCAESKQISSHSLYKSIGNFYFQNKEITKKYKLEVYEKNYVVIDKTFGTDNLEDGLYFISLSITHTTSNLLVVSNHRYYIIKIDEKVNESFKKIFDDEIRDSSINELFNNKVFQEELQKVSNYNYLLKSKRTLKPL
jgi:hypothetical protein